VRILLANKFLYPAGGAEAVMFLLWRYLEADGHAVIPFGMAHPRNVLTAYDDFLVPAVSYGQPSGLRGQLASTRSIWYSSEARRRLARLLVETTPDIAYLHNIYHQLSPSILDALREAGVPVIMTLHDYKLACPNYRLYTEGAPCTRCVGGSFHHAVVHRCVKDSRLKSLVCAIENTIHRRRGAYGSIARFIAPSRFLYDIMLRAGLPEDKLLHWPNPIDLPPVPRSRDAGYVLYSGRLAREKGLWTLMRAAQRLPQAEFRLAGEGPLRSELEAWCLEHHLFNIRFLGFVAPDELPALIRNARCLVMPSEWYENCPMALLEALGHGVPVVAANVGGLPEYVEHRHNGLLVPPSDDAALAEALSLLLSDPSRAAAMGRAARLRAERDHAPRPYLDRLLQLSADLLGNDERRWTIDDRPSSIVHRPSSPGGHV
jgi:glycosyltransferase involved in cell wall biosynthesis